MDDQFERTVREKFDEYFHPHAKRDVVILGFIWLIALSVGGYWFFNRAHDPKASAPPASSSGPSSAAPR